MLPKAIRPGFAGFLCSAVLVCAVAAFAAPGSFQQAVEVRAQALEALRATSGNEPIEAFIDEHVSSELRKQLGDGTLLSALIQARQIAAGSGSVDMGIVEGGFFIRFRGAQDAQITATLQEESPFRISSLRIEPLEREEVRTIPFTWDNLESKFEELEEEGFSGVVMVLRDGQPVLHQAYGLADRKHERRNTIETIFGIGSVPIDFTKGAIVLLAQQGKLSFDDPITKWIDDVPEDKRGITIDHLMTGASGLPNFHHTPGVDEDPDLTYIDRVEAIERMMSRDLMFEPGEGEAHSHSAWGLLAAIVEMVSGQSYGEFLAVHFFEPAGMTRTGFYGEQRRFDDHDYAVGYGVDDVGKINIPKYWGKTSWLVMGSGGMVSTVGDLYKWQRFVMSDKLLSEDSRKQFSGKGVLAGGSNRGFMFTYSQGFDSGFYLSSNAHEKDGDLPGQVTRSLYKLVSGE